MTSLNEDKFLANENWANVLKTNNNILVAFIALTNVNEPCQDDTGLQHNTFEW